jgi:PAS domain S-box-containing protein
MTPIRRAAREDRPDLYWIVLDLSVLGILLAAVVRVVRGHFDDFTISVIACYLAAVFLVRVMFGLGDGFRGTFWAKAGGVLLVLGFAGWLYHEATNVRTGWYRTHVLQDRFSRIIHSAPAYIVLWDTQGNITETSDNIHFLLGYDRIELVGQPLTTILRPADQAGYARAMARAVRTLRKPTGDDAGWLMTGVIPIGLQHRSGRVVPVRTYAGGIRWSGDIQFRGDTDLFALFVPVTRHEALEKSAIDPEAPMKVAPPPPPVKTLVPAPAEAKPEPEPKPEPKPEAAAPPPEED